MTWHTTRARINAQKSGTDIFSAQKSGTAKIRDRYIFLAVSMASRNVALRNQAVIRPTTRRTQGATIATVGKATGHVVAQLFSHCPGNPGVIPCEVARTNAETIATMMTESSALKRMGENRAGIRMLMLLCKV